MRKNDPKPGDQVTCRLPVEAYYSGYSGNPVVRFEPGDVGVVASIAPKVRIVSGPEYDGRDEFLVIDFEHEVHGKQRCSLNFCNVVVV